LILELKHEWDELEKRIENSNSELQRIAKNDDACLRFMKIPGFGPLVSTALVAAIGIGITFRKCRDLSAWLGLVPANTRLAARPNCSASAREETNICDVSSCTELDPW
jgi:transposase